MDAVQDWAAFLLSDSTLAFAPYLRQLFGYALLFKSYLTPLIAQISQKPDLATAALLLVILFVSLKILNMLLQSVLFWMRMARKVVFWVGLMAVSVWLYNRGPEGAVEDVQHLARTWTGEYQHWKEQERVARMVSQGQGKQGRRGW
ncbi:unnamed protein product [Zymoseptoria tritici ST99CH_1E4]|uniref:Uncharacterized protein n=1 Tax=Zymoseptoria tritici ST99CH_1E4 TaxID=1276532 RepID=A0A2H1FPY9_ZYMTR|nr:unnamed protein product [Zymoseptoria tritici ST99CH_1E4]